MSVAEFPRLPLVALAPSLASFSITTVIALHADGSLGDALCSSAGNISSRAWFLNTSRTRRAMSGRMTRKAAGRAMRCPNRQPSLPTSIRASVMTAPWTLHSRKLSTSSRVNQINPTTSSLTARSSLVRIRPLWRAFSRWCGRRHTRAFSEDIHNVDCFAPCSDGDNPRCVRCDGASARSARRQQARAKLRRSSANSYA